MPPKMDIQHQFGARLRELRKRARLTQQRLGEEAEVNFKFVGAIERGEENPSLLVIDRLARALQVAPAELFDLDHLDAGAATLRARVKKLVDAVPSDERATSEELKRLFRVVHALVGAEKIAPEGKRQR